MLVGVLLSICMLVSCELLESDSKNTYVFHSEYVRISNKVRTYFGPNTYVLLEFPSELFIVVV